MLVLLAPGVRCPASSHATGASRPPSVPVTDVLVATDRAEPVIAVNPRNHRNIIAGSNPDYDEHNPAGVTDGFFRSFTGGKTWKGAEMSVLSPYTTEADPSLAVGAHGTAYFGFLGESPSYCSQGSSAVLLSKSTDGGRHFSVPTVVDGGSGYHDKPWVAVQSRPGVADRVFAVWDKPLNHGSQVFFRRSLDGGKTFLPAVSLAHSRWLNFGAVPVAVPGNRVTVVWSSFPYKGNGSQTEGIVTRTSGDGGVTWGPAVSLSHGYFKSLPILLPPNGIRLLPSPAATTTPSGRLVVAWARMTGRNASGTARSNILVSTSRSGVHWSKPVVVNDSRAGDRFMPTVTAISKRSAAVAFYDQRHGYAGTDVYLAPLRIRNGRVTPRSNIRLTIRPAPISLLYRVPNKGCYAPGRFIGDYIGSASDPTGLVHVIWADTQRRVRNVSDVWTAAVRVRK